MILGILIVLTVMGIVLIATNVSFELGIVLTIGGCLMLFIVLAVLPVAYYSTEAQIEQFKATKLTYETARQNALGAAFKDAIENAAMQMDIAKQNRWLANAQYWNETILDIWIPNEVMKLMPLQ